MNWNMSLPESHSSMMFSSYPTSLANNSWNPMDAADKILREIEEMGQRSFIPSIGRMKGKILASVVREKKPKRILEVGALYGYSAILMAKNAPNAAVTTVEANPEMRGRR